MINEGVRITELPAAGPVVGGEVVVGVQSGVTVQLPYSSGSADTRIALTAGASVIAYKVVTTDASGLATHASSGQQGHANRVAGIAINSANPGDLVVAQTEGAMDNAGWSWTPGALLYLGLDGAIVTAPQGAFYQTVGYAQTTTRIIVRLGRSILRN